MIALLTQSRLASARACQRLHHLKYELGARALVELGGRRFGTLIHAGLEAWWKWKMRVGVDYSDSLSEALAAINELESDPFELAKAEVMLTAYHHRWNDEPYDVIAVEAQFSTELRNPSTGAASRTWMLAGKIDVIVRDRRDGLVRIVEHKTSSEQIAPGSTYWKRLRLDSQISVYFIGGASLGHDIAGCVYDVLAKPSIRPAKATPIESRKYTKDGSLYAAQRAEDETPDEYAARITEALAADPDRFLARGEIVRLEGEMTDALQDIWDTAKQIQEAKVAGRAPKNPSACMQWNRECDFFSVCCGEASLDDTTKFVRLDNPHPELEADHAATSA